MKKLRAESLLRFHKYIFNKGDMNHPNKWIPIYIKALYCQYNRGEVYMKNSHFRMIASIIKNTRCKNHITPMIFLLFTYGQNFSTS